MKKKTKILILLLTLLLTTALIGCGKEEAVTTNKTSQEVTSTISKDSKSAEPPEQTEDASGKESGQPEEKELQSADSGILVVYFSRTGEQYTVGEIDKGNTEIVAEMIAERLNADLFEVVPADDHYPMTYNELTDVARKEQKEGARPEYAGEEPDLTGYSAVFIGAPVWWGDWPMIMYTFFEKNADALAGKALIPFSTHEGSGLSGFDKKLSSACPEATVLAGIGIRGNDCQNKQDDVRKEVAEWLTELGY